VKYRHIPNTTLSLSEIGFGCGGNAGLMVRGGAGEQSHIIARALDLGINYFDNAPFGYFKAGDLLRIGLLLTVIEFIAIIIIVPVYWPLIGIR